MSVTPVASGGNAYEQPLVVAHDGQTKHEPAGCIEMPHV
jgi:hypothetical protein